MTKEAVFGYVQKKYGTTPDYPWERYPKYAVLRHLKNKKMVWSFSLHTKKQARIKRR